MAFGFVEDIHVLSNTCKDMEACANTGSVSDEKSKNVQIHASLSKDFSGSLLDCLATDDDVVQSVGKLLTVRQVAKVLGVCPATVYGLCGRGELPHGRKGHAAEVARQASSLRMLTSGTFLPVDEDTHHPIHGGIAPPGGKSSLTSSGSRSWPRSLRASRRAGRAACSPCRSCRPPGSPWSHSWSRAWTGSPGSSRPRSP